MIPRLATPAAHRLAKAFSIVAITGPRQAGKATLVCALFADKPYVSREDPEEREFVDADPRRFPARFPSGAAPPAGWHRARPKATRSLTSIPCLI